jgi:hypothetical protein
MKRRVYMSEKILNRKKRIALLCILCALFSGKVLAESAIVQRVDVQHTGRKLFAIRPDRENETIELHLKEEARWIGAFGNLGAALTSQRFLVISAKSSSWQEIALRLRENVEPKAYVSSNIILVNTGERIAGYDAVAETFIEWVYPLNENVLTLAVEHDVAGVVLEHEVLSYAAGSNSFVSTPLHQREEFISVSVKSKSVVVITSQRILSFTKGKTSWIEESVSQGQ